MSKTKESIEEQLRRLIEAANLNRSGYMPTEEDYYSFDEVANILNTALAEERETNLAPIRKTVKQLRDDLTKIGGFENGLIGVPASGLRHYILLLEQDLKEK